MVLPDTGDFLVCSVSANSVPRRKGEKIKHVTCHTWISVGPEIDVKGEQRTFSLQISCKEALNLKRGESYLIMGQADDVQLQGRM